MPETIWMKQEKVETIPEIVSSISRSVRLLNRRVGSVENPEEIHLLARETARVLGRLAGLMDECAKWIEENEQRLSCHELTDKKQVSGLSKMIISRFRLVSVILQEARVGTTDVKRLVSNFSPELKQRSPSRR